MPVAGKQLLPRELAQLGRPHWHDLELVKMVATTLAESLGFVGAYHDNGDPPASRDCGLMQINVPARLIGSDAELELRTEATTANDIARVARANVLAGYHLYEQPWVRQPQDGADIRRWQPWVAYTTGWATFPSSWVWHQVEGKPVGPWLPTGRYLHQAIVGVANFHLVLAKDKELPVALAMARAAAEHFHLDAEMYATARQRVTFRVGAKPPGPPADGLGPRPEPNNGI